MKKAPTSRQKKALAAKGLNPSEWLCVKTEDSGTTTILQHRTTGETIKLPR